MFYNKACAYVAAARIEDILTQENTELSKIYHAPIK
jgi:hypothetical protein